MNTVAQMQFMNQLKQRIKYGGGGGGVDAYNRLENEPHCLQYLYHGTIYNCTYSKENGTTLNTDLWGAMYNFFSV